MNKQLLLEWLCESAQQHEREYQVRARFKKALLRQLYELNNRRDVTLPKPLTGTPDRMIPALRDHFNDQVTLISRVLHHYFPQRYLFYRVSKLEEEIFEGFEFFSEIVPEFGFRFSKVGRTGFHRYLELNEALLTFAHHIWPRLKSPQARMTWFLYRGLGDLFLERSDYNRYWIMATKEEYFDSLKANKVVKWSGRKEMQPDDLVFMYQMAPRKAITRLFRVQDPPRFDPGGAWDGFWVHLKTVSPIEGIPFSEMRNDPVLGQWSVIRRQFQGVMTEAVPHSIYNRLLTFISTNVKTRHGLKPEQVADVGQSGQFTSEAEFEEQVIEPLLKRWSFNYQSQYPCHFQFGSQRHPGRVDFYIRDGQGPITLFEDKLRIISERDLAFARDQAKSYALMLGLPSFVVAAPEGIWVYSLDRNKESLEMHLTSDEMAARDAEVRQLLLNLRR